MLLEFRAKNYKSFKDELIFSMKPAAKQKGLDYSILNKTIKKKKYKALSSAVIYGPNASGKTNIIGAMETFKTIVLRGHIRNDIDSQRPNIATNMLELIPSSVNEEPSPVFLAIRFITDSLLIDYSFSMDLGLFYDTGYSRKILAETLKINESTIFERRESLEFDNFKQIQELLVNEFIKNEKSAISLAKNNLHPEELFLLNGFKNMFSSKLVNTITKWLEEKFIVVYRADAMDLLYNLNDPKKNTFKLTKPVNEAAQCFGVNTNSVEFILDNETNEANLYSVLEKPKHIEIPAAVYESYGTIRFLNMFPFITTVLLNGGTLIVDEFDASIHPLALMNIINIFHNNEININQAQLIFNTHNPIFLNSNLFRRDEIKFVERDEETLVSSHYSLSDFKTTGKSGVRKGEDYMSNYFINKYGAINDVDFTSLFEELLAVKKEV